MFDLGLQEIIVIFIVAMLVFGPDKLPELARNIGKGIGQIKRAMFDIKSRVETEMGEAEKGVQAQATSIKKEAGREDKGAERQSNNREAVETGGEKEKKGGGS